MNAASDFSAGAEPIDRESPTPLWAQLEHELRRRMELGHFADRFPTDRELMTVYGVSRHTARHAVAQLGADGIVRRSRGVGTSIDERTMQRSLGSLYSLFQIVEDAGLRPRSEVRFQGEVTDPKAASRLGLEPGEPLLMIDRLRLAGDMPLAVDRIWVPAAAAAGLADADFTHTSFYGQVEREIGRRPSEGWEHIRPVVPSDDDREALGLDPGTAAFLIERLGLCQGLPLEWRVTVIRGDRFTFVADWSAGQRNEITPRLDAGAT